MALVHVTKGSRIGYVVDGTVRYGTVFAIDRRPIADRKPGDALTEALYRIAEDPAADITRQMIVESATPQQLKKNVLLSLLDQDVLDNIARSNAAVSKSVNRYGFRPPTRSLATA